jgi:hypothetical protein
MSPFLQMTHGIIDGEHVIGISAHESDKFASTDTKVVFHGFFGSIEVGLYAILVELWAEGEEDESLEYYWKSRTKPEEVFF